MKGFLKNVLANIVAIAIIAGLFVLFLIMMVAYIAITDSNKSAIHAGSVLTLDFKTNIIDSPLEDSDNIFAFAEKENNILIYDMVEAIKKAATDDNIKGISIETDGLQAGFTQIEDVRRALLEFKKSGKFLYAYGNNVSQSAYYLGSVADRYYLHPAGSVDLKGLATEVLYMKGFAEKYGIGIEVIRHGKYKSAVEPFMRDDMSDENREQLSTLLNDIWSPTARKMAGARKMDTARFAMVVDSLYGAIPEMSLQYGLADKLIQKSEYDDLLKEKLSIKKKEKLRKISFTKYIGSYKEDNTKKDNQVAVLYASGAIYNGEGTDAIYADNFVKEIKKLTENDKVKAVVLRINSPGGSANASDEIVFELQRLKAKKPLIVSFGDYAASGGYYIAMAADKIYSEPGTLTGSIGVFGVFPYFKELANRNGLTAHAVTTNANSNMFSSLNGLTPGGAAMMQRSVEMTYKRFVHFVTQNRKKSFEQIDEVGGGRVWSGVRAKDLGLVDDLGTLQDAVKFAAMKAKVSDFNVSSYPKKLTPFEQLFKDMDKEQMTLKMLKSKLSDEQFLIYQQLSDPKFKEGVRMEMPFQIKF